MKTDSSPFGWSYVTEMEYNFCHSFPTLAVWIWIIQRFIHLFICWRIIDLCTCSVHISPFTELFNRFCMYTKGDFFLHHSLLYLHDIQRCAEDFLLDEGALETESPVRPSDISGWAWLGSGQWVVWHRRRVWAGSRNLASSDSNSKRAPYTH